MVKSIMQWELYTALTHNHIDVARGVKLTIPNKIHLSDQPVKALKYAQCWIDPMRFSVRSFSCGKYVI